MTTNGWKKINCPLMSTVAMQHLTTNLFMILMELHALKNVNNYLNTNIYSYLETSGGQSSNLYLIVVHLFNTSGN